MATRNENKRTGTERTVSVSRPEPLVKHSMYGLRLDRFASHKGIAIHGVSR